MNSRNRPLVAIGGIGGSGTRVVAAFLHMLDYYLGDDINESLDNLWFTLLFKRRSILIENDLEFGRLLSLFAFRMSGGRLLADEERTHILGLADHERLQHPRDWLRERARSFCEDQTSKLPSQPWAWKEPNTHVMIDRLMQLHGDLRYLHVVRHPLYMAMSQNQNQLQNWGPIFLNRDVAIEPRLSLSYWCAAHRRMTKFMRLWSDRMITIDFDELCVSPDRLCIKIAKFLDVQLRADVLSNFRKFLVRPLLVGQFNNIDLQQFDPTDLEYLTRIGYPLS